VKSGKKGFYLRYTDKQLRIALRRSDVNTEEFKDRYRWRAGVEATMSEYDRRTGGKRLRVRGLKAVRYSATLKALGINILRAAVVMAALIGGDPDKSGQKWSLLLCINVFKELLSSLIACFTSLIHQRQLFRTFSPIFGFGPK